MTTATETQTRRFRLKRGNHQQGTKPNIENFKRGDVVETDKNLVELFGVGKFEELHGEIGSDRLGEMTVAQLKKFADDEEIELDPNLTKDGIVLAIRAAM